MTRPSTPVASPEMIERLRDLAEKAKPLLECDHRANRPNPRQRGERIVGFVIGENDIGLGLSEPLFALDALVELAKAALEALGVSDEALREAQQERTFVWKWIERALFDKQLGKDECLSTLAHYPGAPWNEGRWDVDHKPYAKQFYILFPKARAALTNGKTNG